MTKKKYLSFSGFLNFCILAFITFCTVKINTSLNSDTPFPAFVANSNVAHLEQIYAIFIALIGVCLISLLTKCLIVKVEKNSVTLISIVVDIIVAVLLVSLSMNALTAAVAGMWGSYIAELLVIGCAALIIICDLLSLVAEEWGHLAFKL